MALGAGSKTSRTFSASQCLDRASDGIGSSSGAGAAYVFRFDPATSSWKEETKLTGRNTQRNNWFGASVAIQGNELTKA